MGGPSKGMRAPHVHSIQENMQFWGSIETGRQWIIRLEHMKGEFDVIRMETMFRKYSSNRLIHQYIRSHAGIRKTGSVQPKNNGCHFLWMARKGLEEF